MGLRGTVSACPHWVPTGDIHHPQKMLNYGYSEIDSGGTYKILKQHMHGVLILKCYFVAKFLRELIT